MRFLIAVEVSDGKPTQAEAALRSVLATQASETFVEYLSDTLRSDCGQTIDGDLDLLDRYRSYEGLAIHFDPETIRNFFESAEPEWLEDDPLTGPPTYFEAANALDDDELFLAATTCLDRDPGLWEAVKHVNEVIIREAINTRLRLGASLDGVSGPLPEENDGPEATAPASD